MTMTIAITANYLKTFLIVVGVLAAAYLFATSSKGGDR